ncbi:uncharacterized protein LOC127001984 [Eriocheir sinensis]|uniref:uncharacterized protein LOC127001984 n=1 Tax=Eriocheir sinensis TaxID=95602 RepID=UPI0021CA2555|nr:uncharacterized protein LOC127001984 [Eriocheir sinensis]
MYMCMYVCFPYTGRSEPSKTESARTKGRPPQNPPKFQFVTTNSSQATLYLSQWTDGGCPITHFSVEYRKDAATAWTTVGTEVPPTRTYSLGGLEAGQRYQLRVTAHNAAGSTPAQYAITTPPLEHAMATDSGVSVWGGAPFASSGWQELRVVVPAAVSTLTLLLTLTTVFVCLKKSENDVWFWRTSACLTFLSSPHCTILWFLFPSLHKTLLPVLPHYTRLSFPMLPQCTRLSFPVLPQCTRLSFPMLSHCTRLFFPVLPHCTRLFFPVLPHCTRLSFLFPSLHKTFRSCVAPLHKTFLPVPFTAQDFPFLCCPIAQDFPSCSLHCTRLSVPVLPHSQDFPFLCCFTAQDFPFNLFPILSSILLQE